MKKIRIWFRATLLDWPYWRVTYKDGTTTYRIYRAEAEGLRDVFNGKMWIDYSKL